MKTEWNGVSVKNTPQGMTERYRCNACLDRCTLVILITEEPPEICIKEVKNDAQAQHNSMSVW